MNTEQEIETVLRNPPGFKAPAHLQEQLIDDIRLPGTQGTVVDLRGSAWHWLLRWWPALGAGAVSAACGVVLGVQQMEINELKENIRFLTPLRTMEKQAADVGRSAPPAADTIEAEIQRLREKVEQLKIQIAAMDTVEKENQQLRARLAAPLPGLSQEEMQMLAEAKERASAIQCVNNLKQVGLALHLWAVDHEDTFPPSLQVLSNQLQVTRILVCPSDAAHQPAADWSSLTAANISYEYLAQGSVRLGEPSLVVCQCEAHGSILLSDGSAHLGVARKTPQHLVKRDGKLYYVTSEDRKQ